MLSLGGCGLTGDVTGSLSNSQSASGFLNVVDACVFSNVCFYGI